MTFNKILKDYPDLEGENIQQALEYATWLTGKEIHPTEAQQQKG